MIRWSWEKTRSARFNPTTFSDCPWNLFIVMAKQSLTGNWSLSNSNSKSVGFIGILRMKQLTPAYFPEIIVASSIWDIILFMVNLVPLHNFGGSRLGSIMIVPQSLVKDYVEQSLLVEEFCRIIDDLVPWTDIINYKAKVTNLCRIGQVA